MSLFVTASTPQDPPKKKQKETKEKVNIIDTTSVSISERPVIDSLAMEQRKQTKEIKELVEKQKKTVK
jgi:hypothetical protein